MTNKYLAREDAPFDAKIWERLDTVMVKTAKQHLVGRRLLTIDGPFGLGLKSIPGGDTETESGLVVSSTLPVVMLQKIFSLGMRDLANYEQDGIVLNRQPVVEAAHACAKMEDNLIFNGLETDTAKVPGLLNLSESSSLKLLEWEETGTAASAVMQAITLMDEAGYHGPYALALTPKRYNLLFRRYPQGNQSELDHIKTMVTEGIYKAPVLQNQDAVGGVLLASGRQYASLVMGQDLSIGFIGPVGDKFEFSMTESLALRVRQPQAVCVLEE
jgi:uncharacterized linocin/CFP29 family protein